MKRGKSMINTSFMNKRERMFYFKLIEFAEEKNKNKFHKGNKMGSWFHKNIDIIKEMNNQTAKNVILEYNMSSFNLEQDISIIDSNKTVFEEKLREFFEEKDEYKFMLFSKAPLFKDKTHMGIWFVDNKHIILTSHNYYCEEIKKQYQNYLEREKCMTANEKYENRLVEFCKEEDYNKFKADGKITFADGFSMYIWYFENKEKIDSNNDKICEMIKQQFEHYMKIKDTNRASLKKDLYRRRLLLFMQEEDYGKFKRSSFCQFKDGVNMSDWFVIHKNEILNSNDEVSNKIKVQYEEYLKLRDESNNIRRHHK